MNFGEARMASKEDQAKKIPSFLIRSARNEWAESIEETVRNKCSLPISYDVTCSQGPLFKDFGYTEICGGMRVYTMSSHVNAILMAKAGEDETDLTLDPLLELLADKYVQRNTSEAYKRVCFLPGHNAMFLVSQEQLARLVMDEPDVMFKPHPLTADENVDQIKKKVGAHRVLDKLASGMDILRNCSIVYTTTGSEMAITGTALGKKVFNISNMFKERRGAYHAISTILFRTHLYLGVEESKKVLANIIHSKYSGLLFPWQNDIEERAVEFFKIALKERAHWQSIADAKAAEMKIAEARSARDAELNAAADELLAARAVNKHEGEAK